MDQDELSRRLDALTAVYGSQKKAAEKLGISVSTFKRYKRGTSQPSREKQTEINRKFGRNKGRLDDPEIQKKFEKARRRTEHSRLQIMPTLTWAQINFSSIGMHYITEFVTRVSMFVRFHPENPLFVEFIDDPNDPEGKPAERKSISVVLLFHTVYEIDRKESNFRNADIRLTKLAVPPNARGRAAWSFDDTMNYVLSNISQPSLRVDTGKRRLVPTDALGFSPHDISISGRRKRT